MCFFFFKEQFLFYNNFSSEISSLDLIPEKKQKTKQSAITMYVFKH